MMVWIIAIAVLVVIAVIMTVEYNSLVVLRNRVDNQSAHVDVQLKRRAELIPNLIEIVKGYAKFEKSTLANIAQLRSKVINSVNTSEACDADAELGRVCSRVLALGESYPELKANAGFLKLQEEFSETENKIGMARQFYNDTVTKYNTAVQVFPKSVAAAIFGFKRKELLQISRSERDPIQLDENTFQF